MIEYYSPHKRFWIKLIAAILVVAFVWYDIAWAGDLYYGTANSVFASGASAATAATASAAASAASSATAKKELQVTNIAIGTQEMPPREGESKSRMVSTMEISMVKKV